MYEHKIRRRPFLVSTLLADSPRAHREFRVEDAGRNAELLQEKLEPVTAIQTADEYERLASHQAKFEKCIDEEELVLLLTFHTVLLQLGLVWKLGAL